MKKVVLCILILIENCHCEFKTKRKNSKIAKKKILKTSELSEQKEKKIYFEFSEEEWS